MTLRVLIVDDSPAMRRFIRRTMTLSGIEFSACLEAGNGAEALQQLRQGPVDIILTDINMPAMSGEEMMQRIDADGVLRHIPALVISTDATTSRIQRMLSLGARGYIAKPFSPETLRGEIERVLQMAL
jgi:two-component system chemotaxis response regulator CheY